MACHVMIPYLEVGLAPPRLDWRVQPLLVNYLDGAEALRGDRDGPDGGGRPG